MRLTLLPADRWDGDVDAALASLLPKHRRNPEGQETHWPPWSGIRNSPRHSCRTTSMCCSVPP